MSLCLVRRASASFPRSAISFAAGARSVQFAAAATTSKFESLLSAPPRRDAILTPLKRSTEEIRAGADLMYVVDPLGLSSALPRPLEIVAPAFEEAAEAMSLMNRNDRDPRPANHGKRPCSNRRRKRMARHRAGDHWNLPTKIQKGCDK